MREFDLALFFGLTGSDEGFDPPPVDSSTPNPPPPDPAPPKGSPAGVNSCLLYTSPSPRDLSTSRMPSSA